MSNIEWTEATWNPVIGCTPVSPGCLNCYAATMARRLEGMGKPEYAPKRIAPDGTERIGHIAEALEPGTKTVRIAEVRNGRAVFTGEVRTLPDRLDVPLKRRKPTMYFVNSMSDLFHEDVPFEFIDRVFAVMALCPQHTFQVLTKRPERMAEYLTFIATGFDGAIKRPAAWERMCRQIREIRPDADLTDATPWPLPNVWLGTSVENQAAADARIPHLLRCPAAVRFLSCEPLLGAVDLRLGDSEGVPTDTEPCRERQWLLHWVIVGGESGPGARPCDVAWIRSIVGQCKDAGVPVFVKQLGARPIDGGSNEPMPMPWGWDDGGEEVERWYKPRDKKGGDMAEWPEDLRVREMPKAKGGGDGEA